MGARAPLRRRGAAPDPCRLLPVEDRGADGKVAREEERAERQRGTVEGRALVTTAPELRQLEDAQITLEAYRAAR